MILIADIWCISTDSDNIGGIIFDNLTFSQKLICEAEGSIGAMLRLGDYFNPNFCQIFD